MKDIFAKKYWPEEDILFYFHFHNRYPVRQIEISSEGVKCLSTDFSIKGDSMLADQNIERADFEESDFITRQEFEKVWTHSE
ncbi:MAG: hypothetical protein ACXVAY_18670 [Mucilaginibacter sp.]